MKAICQVCKKEFIIYPDKIHKGKYCSRKCYYKGRWKAKRKIEIKCSFCGKKFLNYQSNKRKFCGKDCYAKWRSQNIRNISHPRFKGRIKYGTDSRYWAILQPYHPFCDSKGYIFEHRLIAEKYLKRFLTKNEVVHHLNGDTLDNRPENLYLFVKKEHDKLETNRRWGNKEKVLLSNINPSS